MMREMAAYAGMEDQKMQKRRPLSCYRKTSNRSRVSDIRCKPRGLCFSNFSLKRNILQQFWLLTEPMVIARNLSVVGKRFLETRQQA